jgi:hypothetical protein
VKLGEDENGNNVWESQGVAFHSQRYIHERDDGLDSADAWDGMIASTRGHVGATEHSGTPANQDTYRRPESAAQSQNRRTAESSRKHRSGLIIRRSLVRIQPGPSGGDRLPRERR